MERINMKILKLTKMAADCNIYVDVVAMETN